MLSLAAGLDQPSAGEVRAFGDPLTRLSDRELAAYRARQVALIFQSGNLWPHLTAPENVELATGFAGEELLEEHRLLADRLEGAVLHDHR